MNHTYDITLTGELSDYANKEAAMGVLAKLCKLPENQAESHFATAPLLLREAVDSDTAKKLEVILEKVGLMSETTQTSTQADAAIPASYDEAESVSEPNASEPVATSVSSAEQPGLKFEMAGQPDYGFVTVQVPEGETLKVESSAMATMDTNIKMKTKMRGGLGRFITGENIFINEFTAEHSQGEVGIAPGAPGDLRHVYLEDETIYLQNSAFVACSNDIAVESKWQGLVKGFFSGESLFLIRAQGKGDLWFNSYGAIIEIDVNDDYVVDTGNIVAFTSGLEYDITKVGGYKSLFFSGEGLVCRFSGKGKVWIQTRSAAAFVSWAHWFRPVKKKG